MKPYYVSFLLLSVCSLLLLSSCSIEENTTFNNDFSGNSLSIIDMSLFVEIMKAKDTTGQTMAGFMKGFREKMAAGMADSTNPYASKITVDFDTVNNQMIMKSTFDNLDMLNQINAKMRQDNTKGSKKKSAYVEDYTWKKQGKVLIMPGVEGVEMIMDLIRSQKGDDRVDSKVKYTIVRKFPREIEKVSDSRIKLSEDKKTLSFQATFMELDKKPLKEITVTFKN